MEKTIHIAECQEPWIYWWAILSHADRVKTVTLRLPGMKWDYNTFGFDGELVEPSLIQRLWHIERPRPLQDYEWLSLADKTFKDAHLFGEEQTREIWRQVYRIASDRI